MKLSLYSAAAFVAIAVRVTAIVLLALGTIPWHTGTPPDAEEINFAPNRIWVADGDSEVTTDFWAADCGNDDSVEAVTGLAYVNHFTAIVDSDDCETLAQSFMAYIVSMAVLTFAMGLYLYLWNTKRFTRWWVWVAILGACWIAEFVSAMLVVGYIEPVAESKPENTPDHTTLSDAATGKWLFPVVATVLAPALFDYILYRDRKGTTTGVEI
jgi:hypothetical protein